MGTIEMQSMNMRPPLPTPPPDLRRRTAGETVLPLTTIFTPPQSCFDAPFTLTTSSSGVVGFSSAWRDYSELSSQCYPSSFSSLQWNWHWYSPGVCASGYNIAQSTRSSGLTRAWCCPAGYTIYGFTSTDNNKTYQACTSLASNTQVISYEADSRKTITPSFSFTAIQWAMSVEWASSDLSLFHPASAPVLNTATSTIASFSGTIMTTGSHQSGDGPAGHTTSDSTDNGLSTGATAGVAVGVVIAALAVLAGVIFWFLRRRKTRQRLPDSPIKGTYFDGKVELPSNEARRDHQAPPIELDALGQDPQELDGRNTGMEQYKKPMSPAELEGSWHGNEKPASPINTSMS